MASDHGNIKVETNSNKISRKHQTTHFQKCVLEHFEPRGSKTKIYWEIETAQAEWYENTH